MNGIEADNQAEIVINKSSSKDGQIGWSIRLVRRDEPLFTRVLPDGQEIVSAARRESDADYIKRTLVTHAQLHHDLIADPIVTRAEREAAVPVEEQA